MELDRQIDMDYLSTLCRIRCTDEEKALFKQSLLHILQYMELLNQVDTSGVAPCSQVFDTAHSPLREDIEGALLTQKEFLSIAPDQFAGMVRIPPVMSDST